MTKTDLHILMLEDDPFDAELNIEQLGMLEEYNCICNIVKDRKSYLEALKNSKPDIILCDYSLPEYNGLEALKDLNTRNTLIPFIFVTGAMIEETAADAIKAGAWDYVVKDRLFRLPLAVRSVLKLKQEKLNTYNSEQRIHRLLTAIEQTSTQIVVLDTKGNIEYANKKFAEITGFSIMNSPGSDGLRLSESDPILETIVQNEKSLKKGEIFKGEIITKRLDGKSIWELMSITPVLNETGNIANYVAVKEDITERKKMEQDIIEARDQAETSDKLKNSFLQNLSHEIRTPLNAIVGFADILSSGKHNEPEKIRELGSIISKSSEQLLSIVSDVLTMSSIHTGQEEIVLRPVDVNALFDELYEVHKAFANQKKLEFVFNKEIPDKPLYMVSDETKLTQILSNLVENALKYTIKGSVITSYRILDDKIEFSVKDTGIGIAKDAQSYIFERFRQADPTIHTHFGGTGLGLSITKSYVEMLEGELILESAINKGSNFVLSLPFVSPDKKKRTDSYKSDKLDKIPLNLLVAEDEIFNYLLIEAFMDNLDVNILYAKNGSEAVDMVKNNSEIDLVLMDIKMPGMDGITAFHKIREMRKNIPIIAQTAYAIETEKQHLLNIGFNDYIPKPMKKDELLYKINKAMQEIA